MSQQFDPAAFLDMPVTEANVKRPPLPVGDYTAVIKDVQPVAWQSKDGSKSGMKYDVALTVDVPYETQQALGLTQSTIELRDGIMLDLNANQGIDTAPGKNGGLRRYRDALDMNKPGEPFSARMMIGRPIKVKVGHEVYNDAPVERVQGVARPA